MVHPPHLVQVVSAALRRVAKQLVSRDDEVVAVQPRLRRDVAPLVVVVHVRVVHLHHAVEAALLVGLAGVDIEDLIRCGLGLGRPDDAARRRRVAGAGVPALAVSSVVRGKEPVRRADRLWEMHILLLASNENKNENQEVRYCC